LKNKKPEDTVNNNMRILSWNVAGIRARLKKGHMDFLANSDNDVVCIQETKALPEQVDVPEALKMAFPYRYWNSCTGEDQKKGLSGTAIWCRRRPIREVRPMALSVSEGRVTAVEFERFILVTVYTPNSQGFGTDRHAYRTGVWDDEFREWLIQLNAIKPTIVCGDFNVARRDIDVKRPEKWAGSAGLLADERENFEKLVTSGWVDSFRARHKGETGHYTFWNQKCPWERRNNIGWRIDYFLVPKGKQGWIRDAGILPEVLGSDHCPTTLEIVPKTLKLTQE